MRFRSMWIILTFHFNTPKSWTCAARSAGKSASRRRGAPARAPSREFGVAETRPFTLWCAAYSTQNKAGGMLEYAVVLSLLEREAGSGACPGFRPSHEQSEFALAV